MEMLNDDDSNMDDILQGAKEKMVHRAEKLLNMGYRVGEMFIDPSGSLAGVGAGFPDSVDDNTASRAGAIVEGAGKGVESMMLHTIISVAQDRPFVLIFPDGTHSVQEYDYTIDDIISSIE
jgi:hypothetical protein